MQVHLSNYKELYAAVTEHQNEHTQNTHELLKTVICQ